MSLTLNSFLIPFTHRLSFTHCLSQSLSYFLSAPLSHVLSLIQSRILSLSPMVLTHDRPSHSLSLRLSPCLSLVDLSLSLTRYTSHSLCLTLPLHLLSLTLIVSLTRCLSLPLTVLLFLSHALSPSTRSRITPAHSPLTCCTCLTLVVPLTVSLSLIHSLSLSLSLRSSLSLFSPCSQLTRWLSHSQTHDCHSHTRCLSHSLDVSLTP